MDKKKIMAAMEHIDADLVVEAAECKSAARKGSWRRVAIIAACLCLVLAGTVMAAVSIGFNFQILDTNELFTRPDERESSPIIGGHWASSSVRVPVSEISEKVKELEKSGKLRVAFASWAEMEETLGLDVVDNPLLDQMRHTKVYFYDFDDQGDLETHAYMQIYPGAKEIHMTAYYELYGTMGVTLRASVGTEVPEEGNVDGFGYAYTEEQLAASTTEEYLMANGQTAFIFYGPMLQADGDVSYNHTLFKAYFQGENALIMLNAQDDLELAGEEQTQEETLERLKRILDAFE